ncbi:MAG: class I SAM-dependent methyltransferase [Deltaproteobacteria bacterium]|nr:class I SAM-dependent methyltransferase [Deltaproteobacteria bacterium]
MDDKKFDPKKLQKLNNPQRLKDIPPAYIWDKLDMKQADIFVEIGAGTAFFSLAFLQHAKPEKIYACDVSAVMLNWMAANIVPQYPNIIPVKTAETSVPLAAETADLVFMIALHHELCHPDLTIAESYRILKPGGKIFIVDWKKEDMAEGPPTRIRCLAAQVKEQLLHPGFKDVKIFSEMPKHFLVVGTKGGRTR